MSRIHKIIVSALAISSLLEGALSQSPILESNQQYQDCVDDLYESDNGDLELRTDEYLDFVSRRSNGELEFSTFSDLPLSLVSSFNFAACFCAVISSDPSCCVGAKANVNLDTGDAAFIEQNVVAFCVQVDEVIADEIMATPSPTMVTTTASPLPVPTSGPTQSPTAEPTSLPTETPTDLVTGIPTPSPTSSPTAETLEPVTEAPTLSPTAATPAPTTEAPTPLPTLALTEAPTPLPTLAPTEGAPTSRPTFEGELCVNFQYGINNNATLDAEDILNQVGNTLTTGLIIATETVTIDILNETFPIGERLLRNRQDNKYNSGEFGRTIEKKRFIFPVGSSELSSKNSPATGSRRLVHMTLNEIGSQASRRLVIYNADLPPEINNVIDNPFCPSESPETTRCAIVSSTVCVILDEGDDEEGVRAALISGLQEAIQSGAFQDAIPPEHQLP